MVHALPTKLALQDTRKLAQARVNKATLGLNKLKHLPLPAASKAAIIRSALHTVIPYGIYAAPPRAIPIRAVQTLTNDILKGGPHHRHMSNALFHHPRVGEDAPDIQADLPYLAIAELHRFLNTDNFTQKLIVRYLQKAMVDHAWPHHPLDPATLQLKLLPQWQNSLLDNWRQWLTHSKEAVKPSFITTDPSLNPGGWTNFFSSTKFDYQTAQTNRHPWLIQESLRERLALLNIYNYPQLEANMQRNPMWLALHMSEQDRTAIRLQILSTTWRMDIPHNPPLLDPWDAPHPTACNPLPRNSYSVADGAATQSCMSAAWAIGTHKQYYTHQVPATQIWSQPVYGPNNSTYAETYALEGALIRASQYNVPTSHAYTSESEHQATHAQDNQGVLQTFTYYQEHSHIHEGHFVTRQQARPAWRRIRAALPKLTAHTVEWKKGHATNRDINVVDHATKQYLHHIPLEEATALFPDLNAFISGMDYFSLLLTFPVQDGLPIAHPLLPTPESSRTLRSVLPDARTPSTRVTIRHDGTRTQLHSLWRYLQANHRGIQSPTFRFFTDSVDLRFTFAGLATYQIGYWISMRETPMDEVIPPIDSPMTMGERTLIFHLRQGLWVVHQQTPVEADIPVQAAFRMCDHCNQIATLHHVLCECSRPALVQHREHLHNFMNYSKIQHPFLPKQPCCKQRLAYDPDTPTNLVNTRFRRLDTRSTPKQLRPRENPHCLRAWLGLRPQLTPVPKDFHRINRATMHTTVAIIQHWMTNHTKNPVWEPKTSFIEDLKPPPPRRTIPPAPTYEAPPPWPRPQQPRLLRGPRRRAAPGAKMAQARLKAKIYNQGRGPRAPPPPTRAPQSFPISGFLIISGGFAQDHPVETPLLSQYPLPESPTEEGTTNDTPLAEQLDSARWTRTPETTEHPVPTPPLGYTLPPRHKRRLSPPRPQEIRAWQARHHSAWIPTEDSTLRPTKRRGRICSYPPPQQTTRTTPICPRDGNDLSTSIPEAHQLGHTKRTRSPNTSLRSFVKRQRHTPTTPLQTTEVDWGREAPGLSIHTPSPQQQLALDSESLTVTPAT
jgi:ribonuclease HI